MAEAKSNTKRTASMMTMLEQTPETKAWKASRGFINGDCVANKRKR